MFFKSWIYALQRLAAGRSFEPDRRRKSLKRKALAIRPRLEELEDRLAPATISDSGTAALSIDLGINENLAIVSNGTSYTFSSNQNFTANSGTDPANQGSAFSGLGSTSLQLTNTGVAQYGTAINIMDAGAGDTVTFNNSGVNAYANNFNVTLSNAGAGTITFNGNSSFGTFNLQASTTLSISANSGAVVSSGNGNITLTANTQATPTTGVFNGVTVNGATVQSTGNGFIAIQGYGGNGGNTIFSGVLVENGGTISGGNGDIQITGKGESSAGGYSSYGVFVTTGGQIRASGMGSVAVQGTGGASSLGNNIGVNLDSAGAMITSNGGAVQVTGQGGINGFANTGVAIGGEITAGGTGNVSVQGTGGSSSDDGSNFGVDIGGIITSSGGDVAVTGIAGASTGTGSFLNCGVYVVSGGVITAGGAGSVTVQGNGAASISGNNAGVYMAGSTTAPAIITSSGGNVLVVGKGSTGGDFNDGIDIVVSAQISAGGMGSVTVQGTGGPSGGGSDVGVNLIYPSDTITSSGGNVQVAGQGDEYGVNNSGTLAAEGNGNITISGSSSTGVFSTGSILASGGNMLFSAGGTLELLNLAGPITNSGQGGTISLVADQLRLSGTVNAAMGLVTIVPWTNGTPIYLGNFAPSGSLAPNYNTITAGTLQIGNTTSGAITIGSPITVVGTANLILASGSNIVQSGFGSSINANGNLVLITGSGGSVQPLASGNDITLNSGTLAFAPGSTLAIRINGTTFDSQYDQLNVVGDVNLTGVGLSLTGSLVPANGQTFTIVNNFGNHPVIGTFNGLPEGTVIPNFLGSGLNATISYLGGAGHDVVLYVGLGVITTTALVASTSASSYGQSITLTATVTAPSGAISGTMTFFDGISGAILGTGTLTSTGAGSSTWSYTTTAKQLQATRGSADFIRAVFTSAGIYFGSAGTLAPGLTIAPLILTVTGLLVNNKVYDSTTTATLNTSGVVLGGKLSGDSVSLITSTATSNFASKNVANHIAVGISGLTLGGAQAGNYSFLQPAPLTANITLAPLTITATVNTKTYDSTAIATVLPTVSGLKGSDTVAGLAEVFNNKNVGTGKVLSISPYTVDDGNNGGNYTVTTVTNTKGAIIKAALTITALTNTKTYDSTAAAAVTPTVTGLLGNDTVTGLAEVYSNFGAGSGKTLNVSAYTINDGNSGGNYSVSTVSKTTGLINKASLTVTGITANNKVYDGTTTAALTTSAAALVGKIGADSVSLLTTGASGIFANKGPANNIPVTITGVTLIGIAAGNFSVIQPTSAANITVPQGFVADSGTSLLTITLAANQTLGIVSTGNSYTLTSNQIFAPFSLTDPANQSTAFAGFGTKTLTITSTGMAQYGTGIAVVDAGAGAAVTFNDSGTNAYANNFNVALTNAGTGAISFNGNSNFGNFNLQASTAQAIFVNNGSDLISKNGNLTLQANQQTNPTSGNFIGVTINNATVQTTGTGSIGLQGRGGNAATGYEFGVFVENGANIIGGSSPAVVTISGTGGPTASGFAYGVAVGSSGTTSLISSSGGNVQVVGTGGGLGGFTTTNSNNYGVYIGTGGQITAGSVGNVSVLGTGGDTLGGSAYGVDVNGGIITSNGGQVQVTGQGGEPGGGNANFGIYVTGLVSAGGAGNVTVQGTGGATSGNVNYGVYVVGGTVTSNGGNVQVIGMGGGADSTFSYSNYGVAVYSAGVITAGGLGSVTVHGIGGVSGTQDNSGVVLNGGTITSNGGNVQVFGQGGGSASSGENVGVQVRGIISSGGTGNVYVQGTGGATAGGGDYGVLMGYLVKLGAAWILDTSQTNGGQITSNGGNIQAIGTGGGSSSGNDSNNVGIGLGNYDDLVSGGNGSVNVQGFGGATGGSANFGVYVSGIAAKISSANGDVQVSGTGGGAGVGGNNYGVYVAIAGNLAGFGLIGSGGIGSLIIQGIGGNSSGGGNHGVYNYAAKIASGGGNIQIFGISNDPSAYGIYQNGQVTTPGTIGTISLFSNSMFLANTVSAGTQSVIVAPLTSGTVINLGGTDASGTLGLTNTELREITAGTLNIGNADSGAITISVTIGMPSATNVNVTSGSHIIFNPGSIGTDGGSLTLTPGNTGSVQPLTSGTDATVSPASLAFGSGSNLAIAINGTIPDTQYTQLSVAGDVNLSGVNLVLSGTDIPTSGQVFTIVNNQGPHPIVGTFNGLPEGAVISNFLGSVLSAVVSYVGGDGNDVTLTVELPPTTTTVTASTGTTIYGQPVTFSATVATPLGASPVNPTGHVEFFDDTTGVDLGSGIPNNINTWVYTIHPTQLRVTGVADVIRAVFTPTNTFLGSQNTLAGGETITPAPLTITALTNTKNYDGTTSALAKPMVSPLVGTDTITGLAEAYSDKNVGTGKTLSVSGYTINDGNGGRNYAVSTLVNTTGVINKGVLLIQATTNTKSWDGTTSAAALPTVSGLGSGDVVTGIAEVYTDTNVATGKTLSVSAYTVNDGNGGKNYTIAIAADKTGVINPPNSILTLPNSLTVIEPPLGMTYTVYLPLTVNQPLNYTVNYQTVNGTALAGTDFVAVNPGTLHVNNVNNGQPSVLIPITIRGGAYQQPGGPAFKSFTVQLNYAVNNGSGNALTQTLTGMPNTVTTINLQQVFAPKISIAANQASATQGVYVNLTTYWPSNPAFSAAQYAQAGGDVYLNYSTSLAGSLFSSATIKIAAANFVASGAFPIPNVRLPAKPPGGMLTMTLVAITSNAAIDPTANAGIIGYP